MENTPFTKDDSGWYICGCNYSCILSGIQNHMSDIFTGYCIEGIRKGKDSLYQCICGVPFEDWESCEKHLQKADGKCLRDSIKYKSRSCEVCDLEFRGQVELDRHNLTKSHIERSNGTFKEIDLYCKICDIRTASKALMETHLKSKKHKRLLVEPSIPLECSTCNIRCISQAQIRVHLATKKHLKNESKSAQETNL